MNNQSCFLWTCHFTGINAQGATAVSYGKFMFSFESNYQVMFQRVCTILHSCQQCVQDLVSLHHHQRLVALLFFIAAVLISV